MIDGLIVEALYSARVGNLCLLTYILFKRSVLEVTELEVNLPGKNEKKLAMPSKSVPCCY